VIAQGGAESRAALPRPPAYGARTSTSRKTAVRKPVAARTPAVSDAAPPGLRYVSDQALGISRLRRGDTFIYRLPDGKPLRDKAQLERIRRLAIPPAYTDVWICLRPDGHLQATGRDARGRKQYLYHAEWRVARDADKFARMLEFGAVLPRIRRRVQADLKKRVADRPARESVLAALVRLLDTTLVRIGNDEYARTNGSFGLTTLRNRHANVKGSMLRLRFKGKHGIEHDVAIDDPRVARIVRRCQAMPGQDLFSYEDEDGSARCVGSADVNDYLREASGADFTAKDFRTWHASAHALALLKAPVDAGGEKPTAKAVLAEVAARLGNTVAVCKKAYVHPRVLELASQGLPQDCDATTIKARRGLSRAEAELMDFLNRLD